MRSLHGNEIQLIGKWISVGGKVEADATAQRIENLVASQLSRIGLPEDGWDVLFVDGRDNRYWELTYPQSQSLLSAEGDQANSLRRSLTLFFVC